MPQLQLEDEFPDESLIVRCRIGTENGEVTRIDFFHIRTDVSLVLVVNAAKMSKAGNSGREKISPLPETVAVYEFCILRILHHGVGTAHGIACGLELVKGPIDPGALCWPIGDGSGNTAGLPHLLKNGRVVGNLHLVDGDTIRILLDRSLDAFLPVLRSLIHHSGDEIDIDLIKAESLGKTKRTKSFL